MKKRSEVYQVKGAKDVIGGRLKQKRQDLGFSFGDLSDMTGFPKSTLVNLEKGIATNIDYYISFAQALRYPLPELFDLDIELKPRYDLPEDKKDREFLSRKIRVLVVQEHYFENVQSVDSVVNRLEEKQEIYRTRQTSTNTSRVLLNLVEEGLLKIVGKRGRNNLYKSQHSPHIKNTGSF